MSNSNHASHGSLTKKKKVKHAHHEEAHEGEGPWIVSYADMMTLLFCFFVIMTSFASFDPQTVAKKSAQVAEHFAPGKEDREGKELEGIATQIGGMAAMKGVAKSIVKDGVLQIIFKSSIMFEQGQSDLKPEFTKNIDAMIGLIKSRNPNYRIMIEGYTDGSKIREDSPFRSNWDLSTARAAAVVERFEFYGFSGKQLVSVGYGSSRPIAPDTDKYGNPILENQALNRRVVVKVLKPLAVTKNKTLGVDAYFEDAEVLK